MLMIMMTVWNVFSKPMTRIMFSNIGIIITLLLQIEMWTWLKGRTVKLNLFASHKSCFSVWAPSISTRPPLQKKQPCKYAGDKYKHADEDKSQITSLCRRQSKIQKYKQPKAIKRKKSKFCESRSILNSLRIQIGPIIAFQNQSIASLIVNFDVLYFSDLLLEKSAKVGFRLSTSLPARLGAKENVRRHQMEQNNPRPLKSQVASQIQIQIQKRTK